MSFETPQYGIGELLKLARDGEVQLPDFQRPYKWDDERIRSLLVTILRGHPMGVLMVLETGGNSVRFKPKPIEGATEATREPSLLLLDGQQRTTSLFQALTGDGVVDTEDDRKKMLRRRYFMDIEKALGDGKTRTPRSCRSQRTARPPRTLDARSSSTCPRPRNSWSRGSCTHRGVRPWWTHCVAYEVREHG